MNIFQRMASRIYNHVTSFLPWYYIDEVNTNSIHVDKLDDGSLKVAITDQIEWDNPDQLIVVIPRDEIERLLRQ